MNNNIHKTFTTLACAALLAAATASQAQPLVNGGFESDTPGTLTTGWSVNNAGTTSAAYARTGSQSLLIDSTGVGQWWSPNVYQSFAASEGDEFKLEGYMFTPTTIAGGSFGLFKIEFRDAGDNKLQPASVSIGGNAAAPYYGAESTPFLNSASTPNQWVYSSAQAVAPANTATVWFYALNVNESVNSLYFDDIVATKIIPPPNNAVITSPANAATVSPSFTIDATATVASGTITNVYFYDGATLLGNDTTSPYSYSVTGASLGAHALKVIARANSGISVTSSVVNITVVADPYLFTVDPAKTWVGYMNAFNTPQDVNAPNAFQFGSSWGTADLRASFSGSTLTLSPNTINDPNPYWYVTTTSPSEGNKMMEANMYVQPSPSLPGVTVTFTGTCNNNTLTTNGAFNGPVNPAGNGWTCVAFIKDLAPDYSSFVVTNIVITNGATFSISLATINDPTRHVQYGFTTYGPCVWATDPVLASYGNVQIGPVVSTPNAPTITASKSGGNISMSFPTQTGFTYTVQYRTNLATGSWSTLTTTNGTGANAVVTDTIGSAERFYRVSVQ